MPNGPEIDVFNRVKAPSQKGTEGSNPLPSSRESDELRNLAREKGRLYRMAVRPG
jgi:hypothetical protein